MAKREKPFHNPFSSLKLETPKPGKPVAPPPEPKKPKASEDDERALFLASVGEVAPVRKGPARVAPPPPKDRADHVVDPEVEALAELAELVAGKGPMDLSDTDEFIQGSAKGLDPRILKRLRAGDVALQGTLDLHGMIRVEAKEALERFILDSRRRGRRCVLIVHGRGLHSKDQIPVLKESLQTWLSQGRLSGAILAFTTAKPHDGGAGAVYVLLRR
jgi:DNA-nicking Smr family endonuclease